MLPDSVNSCCFGLSPEEMMGYPVISFSIGFLFISALAHETKDVAKLPEGKHHHGDLNPGGPELQAFFEMTRRAAFLMYKVHEFKFYPEVSWKGLVKDATKSKQGITDEEIDKMFSFNGAFKTNVGPSIKFDVHMFEVSMQDMFPTTSEWVLDNGKTERITPDGDIVISNARVVHLFEKTKDGSPGVSILFDLGPKSEIMKHTTIPEIKSGHYEEGKVHDVIMSEPRLEIIVKGGLGKIKYQVCMHALNESAYFQHQTEGNKALQIITSLTYHLLSNPELVETVSQRHLGITYSYQDIIVSMTDYGFQTFLNNWISVSPDKSVRIDLYGAMKTALTNPFALFRFNTDGDLVHKHHEVDFGGLHTPKGMTMEDSFFPGFIYSGSNTDNPELERWITKRVLNISKTVHEGGIDESKLEDIKDWMQNMIREDFRKFRMGEDNVTFHVYDEHFAAQTIVKANDERQLLHHDVNFPGKSKSKRK